MKRFSLIVSILLLSLRPSFAQEAIDPYASFEGEQIKYNIHSMAVKAGGATLEFKGKVKFRGQDAYLIMFTATAMNFLDIEKIYADTETFYPIHVERDLNIWGSKEFITEDYDQVNFKAKIVKKVEGKPDEITSIKKKGKIDNIYCFIYRYRQTGKFQIKDELAMNLPTKDIDIRVVKKVPLNIMKKRFNTFYLQTTPREYALWFDIGVDKRPLRIDKGNGFGSTAMIMIDYQKQEIAR